MGVVALDSGEHWSIGRLSRCVFIDLEKVEFRPGLGKSQILPRVRRE